MIVNEYYDTSDLCLATTLQMRGHELVDMNKADKRRVVFKFQNSKLLQKDIDDFWNRKITVDALTFFDNMKNLKNRIYG